MDPLTAPPIRGRVRWWVASAAAIALLLLAHTVWDYAEARALKSALTTYAPDFLPEEPTRPAVPFDRDAVPYLVAAAALARPAGETMGDLATSRKLPAEEAADAMSPASLDYIARTLAAHADALRLLDVAVTRTFVGYPPGRQNRIDLSSLWALKRLASFRAVDAAIQGDGDAAARSIVAELFLDGGDGSPMARADPIWMLTGHATAASDIQFVLSASTPTEATLAPLDLALASGDDDQLVSRYLTQRRDLLVEAQLEQLGRYDGSFARAGILGERFPDGRPTLLDRIERPLRAHRLRREIEGNAAMIAASRQPWPERIAAIAAAGAKTMPGSVIDNLSTDLERTAGDIACLRAARVAVALERYRRMHRDALPGSLDELVPAFLTQIPADPFSGEPLHFLPAGRGYVVYSVGPNRRDDRGDQADGTIRRAPGGARLAQSGDIGVHITR